jgi:phage gpG-like protein
MAAKLKWHGDERQRDIGAEIGRRLDACRMLVANYAKRLVSVSGTGSATGEKRDKKSGRFLKRRYGANPSKPGEPPHKQTGRLRASITSERDGLVARVGTSLGYGKHLETGTTNIEPRPWLRRSLAECTNQIQAILRKPMK